MGPVMDMRPRVFGLFRESFSHHPALSSFHFMGAKAERGVFRGG